ncbi:AcrR family transcriptional regulator [Azospirillum fermentarium]|uniref:helix-turn-helix domain-containing protein n=1 Tax=Azospirillum fermentarium TaxID=1233114 RepID=UPI0022267143|nr:helix-turn-helix domain-containing protein [Azospirillum fermentarium]MCW2247210.1 AcrR family transcriptional regulator [Azospirillum fermentarium]
MSLSDDAPSAADETLRTLATAAMDLAAARGWRRVSLSAVAERAGVPLGTLYRHARSRSDLLAAVARLADAAVLADAGGGPADESPRDRLFDVMMRRFDALQPFRPGLAAVMRDLPWEPLTALAFAPAFGRSMAWMLRAAGLDPDARGGPLLVAGLGMVDARVMRVFAGDDTPDLSRTMAALDSELRRAESTLESCFGMTKRGRVEPNPSP